MRLHGKTAVAVPCRQLLVPQANHALSGLRLELRTEWLIWAPYVTLAPDSS
jgi:hypothetical protein